MIGNTHTHVLHHTERERERERERGRQTDRQRHRETHDRDCRLDPSHSTAGRVTDLHHCLKYTVRPLPSLPSLTFHVLMNPFAC